MNNGRRLRRRGLVALVLLGAIPMSLQPAQDAPPWSNDRKMRDESDAWRNSFVFDPGRGNSISLSRFASSSFRNYYDDFGFDDNFMLWAPIQRFTVGSSTQWAYCASLTALPHHNAFCPGGAGNVAYAAVGSIILDRSIAAKRWGSSFISIYCGNHSRPGQTPGPIPGISGTKYLDCDADGERDEGEPGLADWVIELYYEGSLVSSTVTDADGNYSFALDANELPIGAGTYEVREQLVPGFIPTEQPEAFEVALGIGSAVFAGRDFGNFLPPMTACRATALRVPAGEFSVANATRDPCVNESESIADFDSDDVTPETPVRVSADVLSADTATTFPTDAPARDGDASTADARVSGLLVSTEDGHTIEAEVLQSSASVTCVDGEAVAVGSSSVAGLKVDGAPVIVVGDEPIAVPAGEFTFALNQRTEFPGGVVVTALIVSGPDGTVLEVATSDVSSAGSTCGCGLPGGSD